MFFFKKESEEDKQAKLRQEAAVKALEAGDLPPIALERLERERALGGKFFSSDLTCREYMLLKELGVQTLGQVMGTCFYKIGFNRVGSWSTSTGELTELTHAQHTSRLRAVERMQKEAAMLGAHGVVGVHLKRVNHGWSGGLTEFTAYGTAIRIPDWPEGKTPFTSSLNGQEFWQLHKAGYEPLGLVMGVCAYYMYTDISTRNAMRNWWGGNNNNNQEIELYTQGFYRGRHLAMSRLTMELGELRADGAVDMTIEPHLQEIEYEVNDTRYIDLLLNFVAMGTAVRAVPLKDRGELRKPLLVLNLANGKFGKLGSTADSDGEAFAYQGETLADTLDDDDDE